MGRKVHVVRLQNSRRIPLVALHIHQAGIDCLFFMSLREYAGQENGG